MAEYGQIPARKVRDTASEIFLTVRDIVEERRRQSPGARIVLDVTGAKKSMIAGAFLAGGFLDLDVSYVDFKEYDEILRRPLPGTSQPGLLDHPYALFKLREELRLAAELDRRRYREAEQLAETLAEMARSEEVRNLLGRRDTEAWAARFDSLRQLSHAYALWQDGFYVEAAEALEALPLIPRPATVEHLRRVWPRSTGHHLPAGPRTSSSNCLVLSSIHTTGRFGL